MIDVLPEATEALHAQEPTRPEAELLRIDVEGVLGRAPVGRDLVSPASGHALERLQQVDVQHHAFFPEFISQPAPVAGEPGARPDVTPPRWRGCLRAARSRGLP
jgi:hypothetical protein